MWKSMLTTWDDIRTYVPVCHWLEYWTIQSTLLGKWISCKGSNKYAVLQRKVCTLSVQVDVVYSHELGTK